MLIFQIVVSLLLEWNERWISAFKKAFKKALNLKQAFKKDVNKTGFKENAWNKDRKPFKKPKT